MENKRRKINLSGGNTERATKHARGPYRRDIFQEFIAWSAMTKEERKINGVATAKVFAVKHDVHESQLSRWTQRSDFPKLRMDKLRERWGEFTPEAFYALRKRIQRFGIGRDVELWLAFAEGWDRKQVIPPPPPAFTEGDIRTLLEYLPKEEQLEFRRTLARLLLKAQDAQEKELSNHL